MTGAAATTVLVPGAWMGGWIWQPTAERMRERGIEAETITLRGLEAGEPRAAVAAVGLDDHIGQLVEHVEEKGPRPVILVSHSYSGMVTAGAADRLGGQVLGLIHLGAFLPRNGRSLLEDWGSSDSERAQERAEIEAAGGLWLPPTRDMLEHQSDLTPSDRDLLASELTAHPGRTITDRAVLSAPVEQQPSTYVALTPSGGLDAAWREAPPAAKAATGWRRTHLVSGHWPMLSALQATVDLLEAEIRHYTLGRA